MKNITNGLWGIVFIILVILGILHIFNVITLHFFPGWWTLFIIVPSFIALFNPDERKGGIIGLFIGILFFLGTRDLLDFSIVWKIIVIVILLAIGFNFIFKKKNDSNLNKNNSNKENASAVFGGGEIQVDDGAEFEGYNCKAIFGGLDVDFRGAKINKDVQIDALAIFGGMDIAVPPNVNIKVNSTGIFGGVDNRTLNSSDNEYTVYINATAIFGGIDIK